MRSESVEARSPPGQWRLLAPALICWAITCWELLSPSRGATVALCAGALGVALLCWWGVAKARSFPSAERWSRLAVSMLALLCAALVLIGVRVQLLETARADAALAAAAANNEQIVFEARLTGFVQHKRSPFGDRAWVRVEAFSKSGRVPMLLWLSDTDIGAEAGSTDYWGPATRITVTARLQAQPFADAAAYTANPASVRLSGDAPSDAATGDGESRVRLFERIGFSAAMYRSLLVQRAATIPGAELVPGFAVGDTSLVPEALDEAMLESSLTHLTAVSGSNTGLVIAAVVWCASRLGARRRIRTIAAALGLAAFVTVVGPDASVLRAAVMASVLLAGAFGGKRTSALPALGLAILTLLVVDPWQALQPGFALSATATGGILLFSAPITKWLRRRARLPSMLALPLAVALTAQLACGPLLLLLQPGIPVIGVLANLLTAPAAPVATGLGLLATVLAPVAPPLSELAVHLASLCTGWVAATAEVCAGLPAGRWHWPEGWPGALLLAACETALLAAWAVSTGRIKVPFSERATPRQPWHAKTAAPFAARLASALLASTALGVLTAITLFQPLVTKLAVPHDWLLVACDVGQGDAVLLRDPRAPHVVMLVDTGDDPEALQSCLSTFGVARISLLVLTHDDRDHVGAAQSVLGRVDEALIAPTVLGERTQQRGVVRALQAASVPYRIGAAGDSGSSPSLLSWSVLAPETGNPPSDSNAASLVLLVQVRGHGVLLLADTGFDEQLRLQGRALLGDTQIDIIKVAHHGSRDQDMSLFGRIRAEWGVISVGAENRYGHPNANTLQEMALAGTRALRTDRLGSVALVAQADGSLRAWAQRGEREEGGERGEKETLSGSGGGRYDGGDD